MKQTQVFRECIFISYRIRAAETLSDMDAEITALEGKLSKARQVKQGMMSVLLTGRLRLV